MEEHRSSKPNIKVQVLVRSMFIMSSIIGDIYKVVTFGESHGSAVGCVIDGCPVGVNIDLDNIQYYLNQRRPGTSKFVTQRNERDTIELLSGVYNNLTTGTPITFIVRNIDFISGDYSNISNLFRPGHADITYYFKYGIRDHRGGGRSSARVTIAIVIAGSLARQIIYNYYKVYVYAYVYSIGLIKIPFISSKYISCTNYFLPNKTIIYSIEKYLSLIILNHNSIGAIILLNIINLTCGIGSPIFNKLNSELSKAIMCINAVKAIDIGIGKSVSKIKGNLNNDQLYDYGYITNNCGGILGGISTSQDIRIKVYIKPTASIRSTQSTINNNLNLSYINVIGRHDPCVGIRSIPIIESVVCIIILDLILKQKIVKFI